MDEDENDFGNFTEYQFKNYRYLTRTFEGFFNANWESCLYIGLFVWLFLLLFILVTGYIRVRDNKNCQCDRREYHKMDELVN